MQKNKKTGECRALRAQIYSVMREVDNLRGQVEALCDQIDADGAERIEAEGAEHAETGSRRLTPDNSIDYGVRVV